LREVGGQTLGDAVDEIVLLRIARKIHERKHHDRKVRRAELVRVGSD
jgi:hypothetical protein